MLLFANDIAFTKYLRLLCFDDWLVARHNCFFDDTPSTFFFFYLVLSSRILDICRGKYFRFSWDICESDYQRYYSSNLVRVTQGLKNWCGMFGMAI